jgi:hypothetical protein
LTVEDLKTVKVGEYLVREQSGDLLRVTTAASTPYDNYWILRGNTGYGDYNYSLADMVTSWSKYRRLPAGDPRIVAAEVARATSKMNAEIEKFKEKVVSVAKDYGKRHDMCSVLAEALEELGLEITNRRRVTVELSVDVPWGQDADSDYINQAFRSGDYSIISDDEDDE